MFVPCGRAIDSIPQLCNAGKRVVSASNGTPNITVWNLISRKEEFILTGHNSSVVAVAVTTDGKRAISCSDDHTTKIWDLITGKEEFTLTGHGGDFVTSVAVAADGKRVITVSWDKNIKVWDLATRNVIASFTGEVPITCCAIAPDGVTIVAGSIGGYVDFLRLEEIETLT